MTPQECASLLALAGAYDARLTPPSRQDAQARAVAWSLALSDSMTLEWARTAIVGHYAESTSTIMPADVNRRWGIHRRQMAESSRREKMRMEIEQAKETAVPMPDTVRQMLADMRQRRRVPSE